MIQTVFSAALPVGEQLVIRKNRIVGAPRRGPRVVVVTGLHGDELEGQYVSFELTRRLSEQPQYLRGTVDIYPAINPLGLSAHERGVPQFDIDLDRTFPGDPAGSLTDVLAHAVLEDIAGANVCVDIHSSSIYAEEVTQVRINERETQRLVQLASFVNARLVWVRTPTADVDSSLAHALNQRGTPTLVVDMGAGMRLDEDAGNWVVEGILRLLEHLHAWSGPTIALPNPLVTNGSNVSTISSESSGIFLPRATNGSVVKQNQVIGDVCDPMEGKILQHVCAPYEGFLFTLRTYPMVYPGSLLARILEARR